jgi:hypothetical protein
MARCGSLQPAFEQQADSGSGAERRPPNNRPAGDDAADSTRGRPEGSPRAGAGLAPGLIGEPVFGEPLGHVRPADPDGGLQPHRGQVWRPRLDFFLSITIATP